MNIHGTAFKYGDNVDTDVIIPARYLSSSDPKDLADHCMEDIDEGFRLKVKPGDVIAAGKNFGCGSSREHAPLAIAASGVSCVIAESYARIFYRNSINIGLPIMECPEAAAKIGSGDVIEADFASGVIINITKNETYKAEPFPPFILEIIEAGGLVNRTKAKLSRKSLEAER
ncbi:MAG: 3-isopropylmalate dehydratase small subunit [Clostridiales bacterium]|jgi:3-isopropylmalate/(R)-2-methylmalate dehydratase small subunit|nr:3-isopropylmalate dehydratase small subunit [Clostridiales bacterium]